MADHELDSRGEPAIDRLYYLVNRLSRSLGRAMDKVALSHGLTPPEFMIFQVLGEGRGISNAQLARRTFISSQATHEFVGELVRRGLVQRDDHAANRRIRLVSFTEAGWELNEQCRVESKAVEARILAGLDPCERTILVPGLLHAAEVLAGGYFGDDEAESQALALRSRARR